MYCKRKYVLHHQQWSFYQACSRIKDILVKPLLAAFQLLLLLFANLIS